MNADMIRSVIEILIASALIAGVIFEHKLIEFEDMIRAKMSRKSRRNIRAKIIPMRKEQSKVI